jgi:Ca-activated chloride channel homolog
MVSDSGGVAVAVGIFAAGSAEQRKGGEMKRNIFSIICILTVLSCSADAGGHKWLKSEDGSTREGNALLKKKEFAKALSAYDKAVKKYPDRGEAHLNRGLSLIRQGDEKMDEAMQAFTLAADSDAPATVLARAEFNLGNAFLKKEDFKTAIDHYKKSLMLQPGNRDAAWNLEVARLKKKQQEEQQKQDQENKEQQDQGDEGDSGDQDKQDQEQQDQDEQDQEQQDQDKQDQDKQDQDKQDQQGGDQNQQNQKEAQKEPEPEKDQQGSDTPEDKQDQQQEQQQPEQQDQQAAQPRNQSMEQMLNALDKEDNDFHKNKARQRAVGVPSNVKDW